MANYKAFSPTSWKAFMDKCAALFPFLKRTFQGTRAEWDALSSTEQANYDIVNITDDVAEGGAVVVDEVTSGNLNAVTSNAVANALPVVQVKNYNSTISLASGAIGTHPIVFDTPMPNANYVVTASMNEANIQLVNIRYKTANGFTAYVKNIGDSAVSDYTKYTCICLRS